MFQLLFPQYRNRRWVYLPLGTLALTEQRPGKPNPLLDPLFCQQWLRRLHRRYKATCSYGGWFEDRSILWNGHYMMPGFTYHLGVDFTVPAHSRIYSPCEGTVIQVWHDNDTLGGWGGRVIILIKPNVYLVLAHMGTIFVKVGKKIRKGQLIGNVGVPNNNGHWFPHLHVQVVRGKYEGIDGYGEFSPRNQRKFPDPLQFWPTYNVTKPL
jgi:murein DD-endopeptidase MepM/ murein hydrolase activator NlpD